MLHSVLMMTTFAEIHAFALDQCIASPMKQQLRQELVMHDLVRLRTDKESTGSGSGSNNYILTQKGMFYLDHILSIPFPVEERQYVIPAKPTD